MLFFSQLYIDEQKVPDVKSFTSSLPKTIGTAGLARSIDARFQHMLRMPPLRVQQFVQFADKIVVPFSIEELRAMSKGEDTQNLLLDWCETLEKRRRDSRPFSAQFFDKNGIPIFFYMGERIKDDPPREIVLQKDAFWQNYYLQLEGRGTEDLRLAKKEGKEIVCDGLAVSLSPLPFRSSLGLHLTLGRYAHFVP